MNSFRFLERGIRAEIARQEAILQTAAGRSSRRRCTSTPPPAAITSLRSKEEAHDYRYFPEPDLVPVAIDQEMLAAAARRDARAAGGARRALRARARPDRRQRAHGSPSAPSSATTSRRRSPPRRIPRAAPQTLANWVTADLLARLGDGEDPARTDSRVTPAALAALVGLVGAKRSTSAPRRQVLDRLLAEGGDPAAIVAAEGLAALDGGGRARADRRRGARGQRRRRREDPRGQRQGDRPDRRATSCARPRAAPTAARSRGWCTSSSASDGPRCGISALRTRAASPHFGRQAKAQRGASRANMLVMNRPIQTSMAHPPRRFLLLPEDAADVPGQGPRIRRYRLTSVGRAQVGSPAGAVLGGTCRGAPASGR